MKKNYLVYGLADTYIHDWLALGPHKAPSEQQRAAGEDDLALRERALAANDHVTCDVPDPPL